MYEIELDYRAIEFNATFNNICYIVEVRIIDAETRENHII